MGAADEVALMYAVNRAYFPAFTARNAFVIIYASEVVDHLNCFGGANFLTLSAGYTAALTELVNRRTLVVIVTLNHYASNILHDMNYTVRAGSGAKAAADTLLRVYLGNTALGDTDGICGTNLGAVTVAKTGKGAESVTGKVHIRRLTGLGS